MLKLLSTTQFSTSTSVLVLAVALGACSPARESEPRSEMTGGGGSATQTSLVEPGTAAARDFARLDLCALLPAADVARTLGYEEASASAKASMGQWATDCTYSFSRGDGSSDYAMLWAYPPQLWAPEAKGEIEEVAGLGDRAFLSSSGSFAQANVLLAGDVYLDTRAGTPNRARALAELAIARLTATGGDR